MLTNSDLIVNYLERLGVEYVFSVPGGPLGPLYDALVRSERRGGPRSVLTRHENGSAFMADGYARKTGRIGVCCATTGPGATNLMTGVASAHTDHIPLLVITAQTLVPHFSRGSFQESSADATDIVGMFKHCTRYNSLISHPDQLEKKLAAALITALHPPKGPAHLSVPIDILRTPAKGPVAFPNIQHLLSVHASTTDTAGLEKLSQELQRILTKNRKVVLLIGHDCVGGTRELTKFAELSGAAVITTPRGKSWFNPYHPLCRGVFGFAGHKTARDALADESVDIILAVGTNLNAWSTGDWDTILLNEKLVHIQDSRSDFNRSPMARMHIYGTIRTVFKNLISRLEHLEPSVEGLTIEQEDSPQPHPEHASKKASAYLPTQIEVREPDSCLSENDSQRIKPPFVIRKIIQRLPPETCYLIDNSNSVPWSIHYFFHPRPENYHLSIGFASMGWAIGASVGMALGALDTPVVCFTGDGCFLMSGQEITVAVKEGLPVIFVILNDQAYGMIRHVHRLTGAEPVDYSIPAVDFCKMAEAVGAKAHTVRNVHDLEHIDFQALCRRNGPTVLDIQIDPDAMPPLGMA